MARCSGVCWFVVCILASVVDANIDLGIPRHTVGNWRGKANYLNEYEYVSPWANNESLALLNSCADPDLPPVLMCSGHGRCNYWNRNVNTALPSPLSFCQCDTYWADPECRTARQSQQTAFVLSVFFGLFGADHFYLGFPVAGVLKLCSLGGFGLWYTFDIVRIGTSPVLTSTNFRVAGDLPHWVYSLTLVSLACFVGFAVSFRSVFRHTSEKDRDVAFLQAEQGALACGQDGPPMAPRGVYRGYGAVVR